MIGVIVHSALFGLGHVDQGWDAAITVGTLGAIWGTIYLVRRSIIAPMVSHAGFNLAQLVKFMALQSDPFARYPFTRADAVETRAAGARLRVRALAARGDAADLRVRRDSVLFLPAVALVRPRRVVRERVPVLLRSGHRPRRRLPRDVPRAVHRGRTPAQLRDDRQRDPVEPVLRRRRSADADLRAEPPTAYSRPYVAAVAYGSAFYGFVAILLSIAAARRIAGPGLLAGIVIWLGTPLLFYMYVSPPYSHACSAFAVALFVTIWLRVRERWTRRRRRRARAVRGAHGHGARAGCVPGAGAGGGFRRGRFVAAICQSRRRCQHYRARGAPPPLAAASRVRARLRPQALPIQHSGSMDDSPARPIARAIPIAAAGCFAFAVGLLPQLFAYKALNGHFGPSQLVTRKMNWQAPHALEVLGSPEHGFFLWTPLAALALRGARRAGGSRAGGTARAHRVRARS